MPADKNMTILVVDDFPPCGASSKHPAPARLLQHPRGRRRLHRLETLNKTKTISSFRLEHAEHAGIELLRKVRGSEEFAICRF
jgi:hypothetical protein